MYDLQVAYDFFRNDKNHFKVKAKMEKRDIQNNIQLIRYGEYRLIDIRKDKFYIIDETGRKGLYSIEYFY